MTLRVYVTENFGTMRKKDRFRPRRTSRPAGVRALDKRDVTWLMLERSAHHAINLPQTSPNFIQKCWNQVQRRWYFFRLRLCRQLLPTNPPPSVLREVGRLRHANIAERRKALEELWQELSEEREHDPELAKVLCIPVPEDVENLD